MTSDLIEWLRVQLDDDERVALACGDRWTSPMRPASWAAGFGSGTAVSAFIDELSPARVLAEVEAKRKLLDLHHPYQGAYVEPQCRECSGCGCCSVDFPCDTVKLLALPYVGRDGYLDEWALIERRS